MVKAHFSATGTALLVPLYPDPPSAPPKVDIPSREADAQAKAHAEQMALWEALRHVQVEVELIARPVLVEWGLEAEAEMQAERKRQKAIEDAGGFVLGMTHEGVVSQREIARKVIIACVRSVPGVVVGEIDLGAKGLDRATLADCLDQAGMLLDVASRAKVAQRPTPLQKKASESPPVSSGQAS